MTSPTPAEHTAIDAMLLKEPQLTEAEERLIGEVAGHLFDRADILRGTGSLQAYADEHDAVMRLRRRCDVLEAAVNERASLLERVRKLEEGARTFVQYEEAIKSGDDVTAMAAYAVASKQLRAALQPEQETA
jgi:hypothetical protein